MYNALWYIYFVFKLNFSQQTPADIWYLSSMWTSTMVIPT